MPFFKKDQLVYADGQRYRVAGEASAGCYWLTPASGPNKGTVEYEYPASRISTVYRSAQRL